MNFGPGKITASIVTLCHNDANYMFDSLRSVLLHTRLPYELVLVDNATGDEGGRFLRSLDRAGGPGGKWRVLREKLRLGARRSRPENLVKIKVIRNSRNRFFAAGNNQGIGAAEGENVVLLNADTWVGPGWLAGLLECLRRHPRAGIVGPYSNGAVGWQYVRGVPEMDMKRFFKFSETWMKSRKGRSLPVHRLAAFCWLVPAKVWRDVGLLDPRFGPGGYEDWDYCMRVQKAGLRIILAEDVFIYHHGGKGYVNMDYGRMQGRNRRILIEKYSAEMLAAISGPDKSGNYIPAG